MVRQVDREIAARNCTARMHPALPAVEERFNYKRQRVSVQFQESHV